MKGRTLSNQKAGVKKMQAGGKAPYVPLSQRTDPESRARALAMSRAMTDKTRAPGSPQQAAVNAARGRLDAARAARNAPPTPPAKPSGIGSMPGASGGQANAQLEALRNRASAAPSGGMGGAGGNMAMVRKGGMLKAKKR